MALESQSDRYGSPRHPDRAPLGGERGSERSLRRRVMVGTFLTAAALGAAELVSDRDSSPIDPNAPAVYAPGDQPSYVSSTESRGAATKPSVKYVIGERPNFERDTRQVIYEDYRKIHEAVDTEREPMSWDDFDAELVKLNDGLDGGVLKSGQVLNLPLEAGLVVQEYRKHIAESGQDEVIDTASFKIAIPEDMVSPDQQP